jgi:putative component of toxin-antitoxin plasmid stabilization module
MQHNLDIQSYKLEDIFALYNLPYNLSIEDMKRAKKQLLMTHPDKSRLPSEYFLFYKKAFDIIVQHFENQQKMNVPVPTEEPKYSHPSENKSIDKQIAKTIQKMTTDEFQKKFNQLFDENMAKKHDPSKHTWFSDAADSSAYEEITSKHKNIGEAFEKIKQVQSTNILSHYRGVENLYINAGSGSRLYDEEEDEHTYVTSDPFSKLKYDDLRKVHKDQTILAVSERDYQNMPKYRSTDHLVQERGKQALTPLEKQKAEQLLTFQEQQYRETMMKKEHQASLKTMDYADKNKQILSSFLYLT